MRYSRPIYTAEISVIGCGYDLRINDCPLQEHARRPVSCSMPLNEWLHNGRNRLSAELLPLPGEETLRAEADLSVHVWVREETSETKELVEQLFFRDGAARAKTASAEPGPTTLTSVLEGNSRLLAVEVAVAVPFPRWAWHASPPIRANPTILQTELLPQLESLHGKFAARDLDAVIALCEERNRERATAYYSSLSETAEGQRESYESILREPGFGLQAVPKEKVRLKLYGESRLARLTTDAGRSPLSYATEDRGLLAELPFVFRKDSQGRWIICR